MGLVGTVRLLQLDLADFGQFSDYFDAFGILWRYFIILAGVFSL
jgi:hypothetical protein